MSDKYVRVLRNLPPFGLQFGIRQVVRPSLKLRYPWRTIEVNASEYEGTILKIHCMLKNGAASLVTLLGYEIMVSTSAKDQIERLTSKPVVQTNKIVFTNRESIAEVAAVYQNFA